ncbi:eukaryotic translation initiation factor 3 subunit G-like isoform X3 [Panicum virgatum]|uniref:eukaryotic translation initiation factor 3 subunit G-like isoform X3 n=1 Tax=Panicum virgatum TaxID=38727 RepID=UPI0019D54012|nr:eukaryotic translation initiation factor 3 subunit G-like isoform X3 [Panicum virgatum]
MEAAVATQQPHKFRWGELEDDGGDNLGPLLPPRVVLEPDAGGLRTVIEYRLDDNGNKVKVTTTTRTRSLAHARLSKSAVERRSWAKFGDAVKGDDDGSRLTMVSTEEVLLERPRAPVAAGQQQLQGNKLRNQLPLVIHCLWQVLEVVPFSCFAESVGKKVFYSQRPCSTTW